MAFLRNLVSSFHNLLLTLFYLFQLWRLLGIRMTWWFYRRISTVWLHVQVELNWGAWLANKLDFEMACDIVIPETTLSVGSPPWHHFGFANFKHVMIPLRTHKLLLRTGYFRRRRISRRVLSEFVAALAQIREQEYPCEPSRVVTTIINESSESVMDYPKGRMELRYADLSGDQITIIAGSCEAKCSAQYLRRLLEACSFLTNKMEGREVGASGEDAVLTEKLEKTTKLLEPTKLQLPAPAVVLPTSLDSLDFSCSGLPPALTEDKF